MRLSYASNPVFFCRTAFVTGMFWPVPGGRALIDRTPDACCMLGRWTFDGGEGAMEKFDDVFNDGFWGGGDMEKVVCTC